MNLFSVSILLLLSFTGQVFGGSCPTTELSFCTCVDNKVSCSINNVEEDSIDLTYDFEQIQFGHNRGDQFFEFFELNSDSITSLPSDLFRGVTFRQLYFDNNPKLTCVDPTAFTGLETTTTRIFARATSFGKKQTPTCNIFSAMSRLTNLETISINGSEIEVIPDYAFKARIGTLNNLNSISFSDGRKGSINKIGRGAFSSLRNLRFVDLSHNKISKISSNAFAFTEPSDNELTINLEYNWDDNKKVGLHGDSFEASVFGTGLRRTTLKLGRNPELKWLKEDVFSNYLSNTPNGGNKLDLENTFLGLYPENRWLIENKVSMNLMAKITHIGSEDNVDFWKHIPTQFSHTHTDPPTLATTGASSATTAPSSGTSSATTATTTAATKATTTATTTP